MTLTTRCKMVWGSTVTFFEKLFDKPKDVLVAHERVPAMHAGGVAKAPLNAGSPSYGEEWQEENPYSGDNYARAGGYDGGYPPGPQGFAAGNGYPPQMYDAGYPPQAPGQYPPQY
ncbi:uncharacterized protein Tco025E_06788 [Trypanosoma conorhini]|uniref:Uncharacterized protein n=1 Tax=Trypanosoma conorhini TaxID=83891 RepID=A0A422NYP2_9TRYP|nr:uncharacterized protein Tco025E_06788 [Trypanosoma conorhini]RNF10539.1 hypothetical protein Tco025E_06788 [Trypanosoma conorhini]